MFDLANDNITGRYWTCLNAMQSALSYGETLADLMIGDTVGTWLHEQGLIERVEKPQYPNRNPVFRLTPLGQAVLKRGRNAHPPVKRPPIKMIKPRIPTMRTGIKRGRSGRSTSG